VKSEKKNEDASPRANEPFEFKFRQPTLHFFYNPEFLPEILFLVSSFRMQHFKRKSAIWERPAKSGISIA
jgi:hypothetical protein